MQFPNHIIAVFTFLIFCCATVNAHQLAALPTGEALDFQQQAVPAACTKPNAGQALVVNPASQNSNSSACNAVQRYKSTRNRIQSIPKRRRDANLVKQQRGAPATAHCSINALEQRSCAQPLHREKNGMMSDLDKILRMGPDFMNSAQANPSGALILVLMVLVLGLLAVVTLTITLAFIRKTA